MITSIEQLRGIEKHVKFFQLDMPDAEVLPTIRKLQVEWGQGTNGSFNGRHHARPTLILVSRLVLCDLSFIPELADLFAANPESNHIPNFMGMELWSDGYSKKPFIPWHGCWIGTEEEALASVNPDISSMKGPKAPKRNPLDEFDSRVK